MKEYIVPGRTVYESYRRTFAGGTGPDWHDLPAATKKMWESMSIDLNIPFQVVTVGGGGSGGGDILLQAHRQASELKPMSSVYCLDT